MNIVKEKSQNVTVLRVFGVIKLGESAQTLAEFLERVLKEEQGPVLLDLEKIDYLDSTGLGELVGYLQRFEEKRRTLAILKPRERVRALLRLTKLDSFFRIFELESDAIEKLSSPDTA